MIAFDFGRMGPANRVLFYKQAYKLSYEFWLDKLDCSVSFHRVKVEGATFDDAMGHHTDSVIPSLILRDGAAIGRSQKPYYEVGFWAMGRDVDWFLYLLVSVERGDELIGCFERLGGKRCS